MAVKPSGSVIEARLAHPEKASDLIEVTRSGTLMEVRLLQPKKALSSIEVRLFGR